MYSDCNSLVVKYIIVILRLLTLTLLIYPRYIGVRSGMATFDLPFPEIVVEEFLRAWNQFELVSAAKEWNDEKLASILPTLL